MDGYRNAQLAQHRTSHLSKLYSDVKKSAVTSIDVKSFLNQQEATANFAALHRKFRIQKDRLVTWGLEWSDEGKGAEASIDEPFARAGLTETVESVLANVKEVTDELEQVRSGISKPGEKYQPAIFDEARYGDLLKDLTTSIDTLYDLSRNRKALARGEYSTFGAATAQPHARPLQARATTIPLTRAQSKAPSTTDSNRTLVNPPAFTRSMSSPYAGLSPMIETTALRLPQEGPPPYEPLGVLVASRQVARLVRDRAPEAVQRALGSEASDVQILVEYADFDQTYRDTGVLPPLTRLEALSKAFPPMRPDSQHNISLLGYFEDSRQPRLGLVYDLPYSVQNKLHGLRAPETLAPLSLLDMLRKTSKTQPVQGEIEPPPLEVRFKLALRLAEQLHMLHLQEFPHGNINSSSVLFATTASETTSSRLAQLRSPILGSFDIFSSFAIEGTERLDIYKHPLHRSQTASRDIDAEIRFDLYSFALLLIEIGLWTPLADIYKKKYSLADFKLRLEKLWIPKLASRCGSLYMRAVQACIRHADAGEQTSMTPGGIYEYIFENLQKCRILDEDPQDTVAASPLAPYLTETPTSTPSFPGLTVREGSSDTTWMTESTRGKDDLPVKHAQPDQAKGKLEQNLDPSLLTPGPSLKEFKRRVTQIQRQWRRYRSWLREIQMVPDGNATSRAKEREAFDTSSTTDDISERRTRQHRPKLVEFPFSEIPQAIKDDWNNGTAVELARLVKRALKGSQESCSVNLTTYGETAETARPTYLVTCSSTKVVKAVLKRHFRCDALSCYVRVEKGKITRCRKSRPESAARAASRSMAPRFEQDNDASNPDYQSQPLCGASIGAYKEEEHLPPVSFGGIVTVDGKSYGMSVHHMLEPDEQDEEEDDDDDEADSDTASLVSMDDNAEPLLSDDDTTVKHLSVASDLSFDEEAQTDGDMGGVAPGDGTDIEITQPALDDAISQNLHADDDDEDSDEDSGVDEDHILSYKLGQVHASSGLKRSAMQGTEGGYKGISASLPQEIDWALFELLPPRVHAYNIVQGGHKFCDVQVDNQVDCYPVAIKSSSELAGVRVHCLGRTSGLASGVISSTMELLKLHGRTTFSASWTVHGGFGVGGDSGAWVIGSDGKVCGHVLAERAGRTYICPMELLFTDMKDTLGAENIALPTPFGTKKEHRKLGSGVAEAVARLRLNEGESGGAPLPYDASNRPSIQREPFSTAMAPMQSAG